MSFRSYRRWVAAITAALFVFSAVAHHAVAAGMSTERGMALPAAVADMASHDDDMPCPLSSDCNNMSMQAMACFAHCATVLGVLADWVVGSTVTIAHPMQLPVTPPLASLHGPPEPYPPRRLS
jgi:hypothetical protein